MHTTRYRRRLGARNCARGALLGLSLAILAGCAMQETAKSKKKEAVFWPAPPDQPRFKYLGVLRSAADIVAESEEAQWKRRLTGQSTVNHKPIIDKPSGIAARNGLVYVAEPAAKGVTVFDLVRGKVFRFGQREPNELQRPQSIAVDAAGLVYVLDTSKHKVMVFDNLGLFIRSIGVKKGFSNPVAVAVSPDGETIYVVDRGEVDNSDHKIVAFAPDGTERFRLGSRGSDPGQLNIPLAATVGPDGTLYVADAGNFRVQMFDAKGNFKSFFGGVGAEPGKFSRPRAITLDPDGNIYVADAAFNNIQIFDPSGQLLMHLGGLSRESGPANYALIAGIAVDEKNHLYVVDHYFNKIEVYGRLSDEEGRRLMASR